MSWIVEIVDKVAELAADALDTIYDPDAPISESQIGVVAHQGLTEYPPAQIAVNRYGKVEVEKTTPTMTVTVGIARVQILYRAVLDPEFGGSPTAYNDMYATLHAALHQCRAPLGDGTIVITEGTAADLGADENDRPIGSINFTVTGPVMV